MATNRHLYTLSICILVSLQTVSFARPVSLEKAKEQAAAFFASNGVRTRASLNELELTATFPKTETRGLDTEPTMYVFSVKSGGFAIIAGDDAARPVLAFSLEQPFVEEGMPDNLRYWLEWYSDVIEYARSKDWGTRGDTPSTKFDPSKSVELKTARWDQVSPFNDLLPEIDGKKPYTGCVATAISIIMKYHKWPIRGTGTLPSYKTGLLIIDSCDLGHAYKWDKMLDDYKECDAEGKAQLARLLYDVAVMCKMSFGLSGSTAFFSNIRLLPVYFGYDPGIIRIGRHYSDEKWETLISEEIDSGRPVFYSGSGGHRGGHAMVIDGYNGRYFSINFGWGGTDNGYYTLSPIDGDFDGIVEFYQSQEVALNIKPYDGGKGDFVPFVSGNNSISEDFEKTKRVLLKQSVNNDSYLGGEIEVRYVLYDRRENVKEVISPSGRISFEDISNDKAAMVDISGRSYHVSLECHVTKSLEEGDMIALSRKDPSSGKWVPLPQGRSSIIVFTTRPIASLLQFGMIDLNARYEHRLWGKTSFSIFDSLYWSLSKEGENTPIFGSYNQRNIWPSSTMQQTYSGDEIVNGDRFVSFNHLLDTGNYVFRCYNPATGEKMTVNLEL